jgi:D-glucosaminate-specific PTS system IID component
MAVSQEALNKKKITKKDLTKTYWLWYWISEICLSFERLQALAFCTCLIPILKKLYPDKEDLSAALKRHLNFFNTEGIWGCCIHSIVIAMEEQKANGEEIPDEAINGLKTALMGPLAGIGDTIDWATLKPLIYGFAATVAMTGNGAGALITLIFTIITAILGYYIWHWGYKFGTESISKVLQSGLINEVIIGTSIMGLFMMGALSANFVKLTTPVVMQLGSGKPIPIQGIFDGIAPGLLPLAVTFSIYLYMSKKGLNVTKIVVFILIACLVGSFMGIF